MVSTRPSSQEYQSQGQSSDDTYYAKLRSITTSTTTPRCRMITKTIKDIIQPLAEDRCKRNMTDHDNKQHLYIPPTLEELLHQTDLDHEEQSNLTRDAKEGLPFHPSFLQIHRKYALNWLNDLNTNNINLTHRMYLDVPKDSNGNQITNMYAKIDAVCSLLGQHKGEVRLLHGHWEKTPGTTPTQGDYLSDPLSCSKERFNELQNLTQYNNEDHTPLQTHQNNITKNLYNTMLAEDNNNPSHFHWIRNCSIWSLPTLLTNFGEHYTTTQIYAYYLSMPILSPSCHRGRAAHDRYKRQRNNIYTTAKASTKIFMKEHNITPPTTPEQLRATCQLLGDYMAAINYMTHIPTTTEPQGNGKGNTRW